MRGSPGVPKTRPELPARPGAAVIGEPGTVRRQTQKKAMAWLMGHLAPPIAKDVWRGLDDLSFRLGTSSTTG
jgi:hypothetical protein